MLINIYYLTWGTSKMLMQSDAECVKKKKKKGTAGSLRVVSLCYNY